MKSTAPVPHKRGWRGFRWSVLALVLLSLLVPLFFLLNQSGYSVDDQSPFAVLFYNEKGARFKGIDLDESLAILNHAESEGEQDKSGHVDDLIRRLGTNITKDVFENITSEATYQPAGSAPVTVLSKPESTAVDSGRQHVPLPAVVPKGPKTISMVNGASNIGSTEHVKGVRAEETDKPCQLEFGSYCLWRDEHKEEMKDAIVKKLKDQLFVARAYYPSIAKLPAQDKLSREMKINIQEFERMLSEATSDADLPPLVERKIRKMESVIAKAKMFPVECSNLDKKLRQILDLTEEEAHFHMKQSAYLYQLAVQTMPKSLHCLSMRLTVEYFRSHLADMELLQDNDKYEDPVLSHYVILSNHLLAASVVINSTVMHSKESRNQVFHVVTNGQNYVAMKLWFFRNNYKNATINVLNVEELNLEYFDGLDVPNLSVSDEFRVFIRSAEKQSAISMRTQYFSVFGPTHFLLPKIFPKLRRVVVLGDDVVVQQDLSPLWSLDLKGKVNGAVEYCGVKLGELKSYLGQQNFDSSSCAWISGLNVIDLDKWRERNLTELFQKHLVQQRMKSVGTLPANLLTFQNQIFVIDSSWLLSGLGHDYGLEVETIKKASVLHYNGNMKPWLEVGIPKYKRYWKKYLKTDDQFMIDCNVNS